MKMFKSTSLSMMCLLFVGALSSCSNNDPAPVALTGIRFNDLNADYAPLVFPTAGGQPTRPAQKRKYTFFSFKTGQIVANTDSATSKWDIGFQSTNIIFNGGTSGSGSAGALVQKGIFDEIKTAPTSGYILDNKTTSVFAVSGRPATSPAAATNEWWYSSGSANSTIVASIAGQVIIVKTTEGRYAKMEILSFYKGAPATVNNLSDLDRHYTFRYVYQPGQTNSF